MKSNLASTTTTGEHVLSHADMMSIRASRTRISDREIDSCDAAPPRPHLRFADSRAWSHTLVLTGELDYRAVTELEEEIECLCEEGVTKLTLDLRQLNAIDSTGVTVIAFRSAVCKRRGHDFAVIPGSRIIHRALAEAGAGRLVTPEGNEDLGRRFAGRYADVAFADRATTMVKTL